MGIKRNRSAKLNLLFFLLALLWISGSELLAYLYAEDGSMLNYELVRNGYGRYYGKFKFDKQNMVSFSQAEAYARERRLGLWGLEGESQMSR